MKKIFLVFPHQLFKDISLLQQTDEIYLVEELLFFRQYNFHKQKLVLHRASMKYYEDYLKQNKLKVNYINAFDKENDVRVLVSGLSDKKIEEIHFYDVCDEWLEKRLIKACTSFNIRLTKHDTLSFINNRADLSVFFKEKKKYFQTEFYIQQRKKLKILIDVNQNPAGGKWSFDTENRLKYPKDKKAPVINFSANNKYYDEAIHYVEKHFPDNIGSISCFQSLFVYWMDNLQFKKNRYYSINNPDIDLQLLMIGFFITMIMQANHPWLLENTYIPILIFVFLFIFI